MDKIWINFWTIWGCSKQRNQWKVHYIHWLITISPTIALFPCSLKLHKCWFFFHSQHTNAFPPQHSTKKNLSSQATSSRSSAPCSWHHSSAAWTKSSVNLAFLMATSSSPMLPAAWPGSCRLSRNMDQTDQIPGSNSMYVRQWFIWEKMEGDNCQHFQRGAKWFRKSVTSPSLGGFELAPVWRCWCNCQIKSETKKRSPQALESSMPRLDGNKNPPLSFGKLCVFFGGELPNSIQYTDMSRKKTVQLWAAISIMHSCSLSKSVKNPRLTWNKKFINSRQKRPLYP